MLKKPPLRAALIWPGGLDPRRVLPLPFAWLAANTDPALCEFRLFDLALGMPGPGDLGRAVAEFSPDIICVSCFAMNFPAALEALRAARAAAPSAVTVMGGQYASPWPEGGMAHPEIDFVIKGEGERAFSAFARELRSGERNWEKVPGLVRRDSSGRMIDVPPAIVEDLDSLAPPDYKFIRLDEYLRRGYRVWSGRVPNAPIQTTRGCSFSCSFCTGPYISGRKVRAFSTAYLMRWIRSLYGEFGIRRFNVMDDSFTHDRERAKAFCREVIGLGLPGLSFGSPNGVRMQGGDPELWRLMKKAGWEQVVVAPESGSDRVLSLMRKGLTVSVVRSAISDIRAAGLPVCGFFIAGYPGETPDDLKLTLRLMKEFDLVEMFVFQPLPGSPVFRELLETGKIEASFLPSVDDFSSGRQSYVSEELRGVNLYRVMLWARLSPFLRNPMGMLLHLRHLDPRAAAVKLVRQIADVFRFSRPGEGA